MRTHTIHDLGVRESAARYTLLSEQTSGAPHTRTSLFSETDSTLACASASSTVTTRERCVCVCVDPSKPALSSIFLRAERKTMSLTFKIAMRMRIAPKSVRTAPVRSCPPPVRSTISTSAHIAGKQARVGRGEGAKDKYTHRQIPPPPPPPPPPHPTPTPPHPRPTPTRPHPTPTPLHPISRTFNANPQIFTRRRFERLPPRKHL